MNAVDCKEKLCEELFYAGEKGDVERCRELITRGANVNWKAGKQLWFRTALMQAAKSGMTDVCKLYLEHGADVNACTQNHFTACILAARSGSTETCQLLLSKGANVNHQTKNGETALMWAAGHGHCDTCKHLVKAGADVNVQDEYGFTALIRAAKNGHTKPCIALLDAGADVTLTSTLGNKVSQQDAAYKQLIDSVFVKSRIINVKVWDAEQWASMNKHRSIAKLIQSHKVRCALLKDGSDPPSNVTLNVCGSVNAGKTTLVRNLQLNYFQRMRRQDQPDTSQDMAARTAGIEVGIIDVPGVGVFRKMDMAGHSWAFTSNEYFIGKRTSISLVLFDLSKADDEVENDLFHHLGSLRARETKCGFLRYRPEVVLVATHADKMDIDPQTRAKFYFRMALANFEAYINFYPKVMVLDCTDPKSNEFTALRECLKELRDKIIQNSERVPRLCAQMLPRIRALAKKKPSFPVISWEEFVREVKEVNKTADEEGVRNAAFYLNESAEIVNDNSPELRDKVVLDVNWLTSHIFGIALAPANFPRSLRSDRVSGMVAKADLQANFSECPLEQLIELFVRFEVCIPWDEQKLLCDNYLFPSHLEHDRSNLDDVWPQFGSSGADLCVVGRIVECKSKIDTLPHSFFPKFQIRLLRRFGHRSPVWLGGIKVADDTVEILVTLSPSLRSVNICVWAPKGFEERCYMSLEFIESLRNELLEEVAGGVEFLHQAMSVKMLHQKRFVGYPLNIVDEALEKNDVNSRVVLENCGVNELAVDVKYCGVRRYVHPPDHVSHMTLKDRKELAELLDNDCNSNLTSLSEQLGVRSVPVENEDMVPPGFTDVISRSETDRFLSHCAVESDVRATDLISALECINRFDAASIVGRWLSSINTADQELAMHRIRSESGSLSERSSSINSRKRGTSEASEGSPLLELSRSRRPCICDCSRHSYDSSEHSPFFGRSLVFPRGARALSHSSIPDVLAHTHARRLLSSELKGRSASESSEHSCSTEESLCLSLDRLSCEESQNGSSEQIVPQPCSRRLLDPCRSCQLCAPKLPLQETEGPKAANSVQETTSDSCTSGACGVEEEFSKEESLPTAETSEPDTRFSVPLSSLLPELSSRMGLSWMSVAFNLGFRASEFCRFEETSLLRVQASQMLQYWLDNNRCILQCEHCEKVIMQKLGEAFEDARRADLKDFLDLSKQ